MSNELKTLTQEMLPALNKEMKAVFQVNNSKPTPFYGMMHYHMGWVNADMQPISIYAGKQIRPLMCLLACAAAGGDWQQAVPAAASVEILHNFSLVHDDIEDDSPTRRGRDTVWKLWGVPQAINAGDAMFAISHLAMARLIERGVPADIVVKALRRFDETCVRLTQGQNADMDFETRDRVTTTEYIEMITGKTAVLVSYSMELGALIAGAHADTVTHYAQFGLNLGLAFQVIDDILGIWGNEAKIGKSASTDITTKKKTLPVLYGLEQSTALQNLYATAKPNSAFVTQVVALLNEVGADTYAQEKAAAYSHSALQSIKGANPQGKAGQALHQLADMLLKRDF
ncbi:MAG: polyprenyl synthetase [Chloroflexi bacterium]|nr:MAG: polyprenyl synthetase [Chloroflexota bacterium]PIE80998.1 MAG: polyprenyl synthetase [Chloroflexota bacterium]